MGIGEITIQWSPKTGSSADLVIVKMFIEIDDMLG